MARHALLAVATTLLLTTAAACSTPHPWSAAAIVGPAYIAAGVRVNGDAPAAPIMVTVKPPAQELEP